MWAAAQCTPEDISVLIALSAIARITELHLAGPCALTEPAQRRLFVHGRWSLMRCVRVNRPSVALLELLALLPLLSHLELDGEVSDYDMLHNAKSLTSLAVRPVAVRLPLCVCADRSLLSQTPMTLSTLPAVPIQLLMNSLQRNEVFSLARCSPVASRVRCSRRLARLFLRSSAVPFVACSPPNAATPLQLDRAR